MSRTELFYLAPYLISLTISSGVFLFTWRRRETQGSGAFAWYFAGQAIWTLAYIFEILSINLRQKVFWDSIEWLATAIAIVAFPIFAAQYAKREIKKPKKVFLLSLLVPTIFVALVFFDSVLRLVRIDQYVYSWYLFSELRYTPSYAIIGYVAYAILVVSAGIVFIFRQLLQPHNLFRGQALTIIVGTFLPALGAVSSLLNIQWPPWQNPFPLSVAIGNIIIIWGFYRFQIFKIIPVGRDKVFEDLVDPVVILDNQNIVVDINRAMLDLLGKKASDVIGQPAKEVFLNSPLPIKMYTDVTHARVETMFEMLKKNISYEMTVWPMYDQQRKLVGRIFISHDITALKELEQTLRNLNAELEKRVQSRTEDLASAYDTTLEGWAKALEFRDKETEGHSRRVTEITLKIARALEIHEDDLIHIHRGALLHDIGKMAVPDDILRKSGPLTDAERTIIRKHPGIAHQLLEPIPFLKKAMEIPYCHHERWDGSGYPRGLKEREIPVSARIFAVADVWDAVQSNRPYKKGWPREQAIEYLKDQAGSHFDPRIVDVFLRLVEKGEI